MSAESLESAAEVALVVRRAEALIAAGELPAAAEAARCALRSDSGAGSADAHRVLGHALLLLGEEDAGAAALRQAADLAGDRTEDWFGLWKTCIALGRRQAAVIALQEVLTLKPEHDAANAEVARRQMRNGDEAGGRARLVEVLRRRPDAARCRLELASQLIHDDQAAEGLALLEHGAPEPDQQTAWALQRVHALIRLGRVEEATAALAAIGEPPPGCRLLFRNAELRLRHDDAAADALEASLDAADEDFEDRVAAHFTLSRFWIRRDAPDRAFPMMQRGHALLREQEPFSREDYRRFVDATLRRLDAARLTRGPRASNTSAVPVFVVGMPRSGTTLMEQILASHGSVFGAGERRALSQAFHQLGGSQDDAACVERIADLDTPALDVAAEAYLAELTALAPDKLRIVDKMPGNFRLLGLASLLLPGARIIHCVRDPRDIGLSIFSMRFRGHHPYSHDLADLGWYIARHHELMDHWRANMPNPVLRIHLHEWVRNFDRTLARTLDFVGLPNDPACSRFYELHREVKTASRHQVRESVNAKGMSRWRPYATHLAPLINEIRPGPA